MDRVIAYYDGFDEWARLDTAEGRVEFRRMCALIDRYVGPGSRLLDLGGGPGRYTLAMAERGHSCQLVDLSPRQVEIARTRIGGAFPDRIPPPVVGDAADLSGFATGSFDSVLAFGPFYHLTDPAARAAAAAECHRVLGPGGVLMAAFIPRIGGVAALIDRAARRPDQVSAAALRRAAETGVFENAGADGFPSGIYMTPEAARDLLAGAGFERVGTVSVRSVLYGREAAWGEIAARDPAMGEMLERLADELAAVPEVVATGGPALAIGWTAGG